MPNIIAAEGKSPSMVSHSDFYLKLGDIKGESLDDKHKGEMELLSFSFGVAQPGGAASVGTGSGVGKAQFHEFEFTKLVDAASAKLMLACASGQHFPEVTLTCRRAGGTQAEYMKIKMEQVLVSGYTIGPGDSNLNDRLPVDTVRINYSKIGFNYKAQNADGSEGANTMTGWDLNKNVKI